MAHSGVVRNPHLDSSLIVARLYKYNVFIVRSAKRLEITLADGFRADNEAAL